MNRDFFINRDFIDREKGVIVCRISENRRKIACEIADKICRKCHVSTYSTIRNAVRDSILLSFEKRYGDCEDIYFMGKAKTAEGDVFDESYGRRLAKVKAMKKYHAAVAKAYADTSRLFYDISEQAKILCGYVLIEKHVCEREINE